jgi:LPS-assembly protein
MAAALAALAGPAAPGWAQAQEAAPSQAAAQPAGISLRLETELRERNLLSRAQRPVFARGAIVGGRTDRETTLEGDAEIRSGSTVIRADRLTRYDAEDDVIAIGNVRLSREGQIFTGPQLQIGLDSLEGVFDSPRYQLPATGGSGSASRVDFLNRDQLLLTDATYSTCKPADPDWYLKADELLIDRAQDEGIARSAVLYFKDVPIFAASRLGFPLADERRSGFLAPTFSQSSTTGTEIMVPYYLNIAPNRDMVLSTNYSVRRGLQFSGNARLIDGNPGQLPIALGTTLFEVTPYDLAADRSRWMINSSYVNNNYLGWIGGYTFRGVSDDNYFVDYSKSILQSADRSLLRNAFIGRQFGNWTVRASVTNYQNILDARNSPPYNRMPQLLIVNQQRDLRGFDIGVLSDTNDFRSSLANSAQGWRSNLAPTVSYPMLGPAWFITPRATVRATAYRLDANPQGPNDIGIAVPTVSVDSGLVFERNASFGGRNVIQTLEPRLFYVYTPYRDQSKLPNFDTAQADLNLSTLFNENVYVGGDRVADANQVTAAALTRIINPDTGIESLRFGLAERFYFMPQRVTLPGQVLPYNASASRSDLLMLASGNLGGGHTIDAGVQFSVAERSIPRMGASWRWWPSYDRLVNVAVRYKEFDYSQIDASWRWPISGRWNSVGRANYSVLREQYDSTTGTNVAVTPQLLEGLLGLEYQEDCWTLRFVVQRFLTATSTSTSAVFVQLELGGLGRFGLDPFDILRRNIPGYRPPSRREIPPSRFYGYE